MAYANADANADLEKIKANFEHNEAEKKVAYVKADVKADAIKSRQIQERNQTN